MTQRTSVWIYTVWKPSPQQVCKGAPKGVEKINQREMEWTTRSLLDEMMMAWILIWAELHFKNQSTRPGVNDSGQDKITLASSTLLGTDTRFYSCDFLHLLHSPSELEYSQLSSEMRSKLIKELVRILGSPDRNLFLGSSLTPGIFLFL